MTDPQQHQDAIDPLHVFRFHVDFHDATTNQDKPLCRGAFSEVTGLELTMEPVAVSEGGNNWGQRQLVGRTTFGTVILKRGLTATRHLWQWFHNVNQTRGAYARRLHVTIRLQDTDGHAVLQWKLLSALPVKLKLADLTATAADVGVEELHLVHEGIEESLPAADAGEAE